MPVKSNQDNRAVYRKGRILERRDTDSHVLIKAVLPPRDVPAFQSVICQEEAHG